MAVMTYREAIKSAMAEEMERDERVVLLGEDIGLYGGTHLEVNRLFGLFHTQLPSTSNGPTGVD